MIHNWTIPDSSGEVFVPKNIISIQNYAFAHSKNLKAVTFCQPSSLKSIGTCAFQDCVSLRWIALPSSVETIGDYAFRHCLGLPIFSIPSSVKMVGNGAFKECACLSHLVISDTLNGQVSSWEFPADLVPFVRITEITQNTTLYKMNVDNFDWANGVTISGGVALTFGENITLTSSIFKHWR